MIYYHLAPISLGPGSIIQPGNFGRMLSRYGCPSVNWLLARELVFEAVRAEPRFFDRPSRLNACFGLPSEEDANKYRAANDQGRLQVLHSVEMADPEAVTHIASLTHLNQQQPTFLQPTRDAAIRYWDSDAGDPQHGFEVVTASPWRVIECLG
jgi:hypothetical protein